MTRAGLSRWIGASAAAVGVLVMLTGSDLPPPPGFLWVVAVAGLAGGLVAVLVPRLLGLRDRAGTWRAIVTASGVGLAVGVAVAVLFLVASPGEPSTPRTGIGEVMIFLIVCGSLFAAAAAVLAGWAVLGDAARSREGALLVLVVPVVLTVSLLGLLIVLRAVG